MTLNPPRSCDIRPSEKKRKVYLGCTASVRNIYWERTVSICFVFFLSCCFLQRHHLVPPVLLQEVVVDKFNVRLVSDQSWLDFHHTDD